MPERSVVDRLEAWRNRLPLDEASVLPGGHGGGTSDGMEPRVAALEAHVAHIQADVADLKSDLRSVQAGVGTLKIDVATLKERTPTKTFIVQALVGGMALFAAVIAFADQIKHLLGMR